MQEKSNIYIPTKCKVGFQKRSDTYTGFLGFIIYHKNNEWKQLKSWEGWRELDNSEVTDEMKQKAIDSYNRQYYNTIKISSYDELPNNWKVKSNENVFPIEFDNTPMEGFTLNRKVGGYSSGWNHRQAKARVYHPLGFEFEITFENLLYILENTSCIGKAFENKMILGWEGKDLVLIPENAPEYQEMQTFTSLQSQKINKKDLVQGYTYQHKNMDLLVYLGHFDFYDTKYAKVINGNTWEYQKKVIVNKKFWFYNIKHNKFETYSSISSIAKIASTEINSEYVNYMEKLEHNSNYSPLDESKYQYIPLLTKEEIEENKYYLYLKFREGYYQPYYSLRDDTYSKDREITLSYLSNHDYIIPAGVSTYDYLLERGVYKQIKYLKNGKEQKY